MGKGKNLMCGHPQAIRWTGQSMKKHQLKNSSAYQRAITALSLVLALAACDSGQAAGDATEGMRLARQWCSGCHSVDQAQQGSDAAPSFDSIARKSGDDQTWLKAWLASPHPAMPDMTLSRDEIDAIVAYLSSLPRH